MKVFLTYLGLFVFCAGALAQNDSCRYTLVLNGNTAKAWQGAEVGVNTKSFANSFSIASSTALTDTFRFFLKSGDTLKISYKRGLSGIGNSYALINSQGLVVFKDGLYPDTGLVYQGRITCSDCPVVNSVFPTNIKGVTAKWNWAPVSGINSYLIKYGKKGFFPSTQGQKLFTTDTFITIKNLEEMTRYQVYLGTICAAGDTSYLNGPFEFKTLWRNDVGMIGASRPLDDCDLGVETVTALIKNFGGDPQAPIKFGYKVNGVQPGIPDIVDGLYTNVVGKDSIAKIDFETQFDFKNVGEYTITTWTELKDDSDKSNDTAVIVITHIPTITTLPAQTNFESWASGWTVPKVSKNATWKYGRPSGQYVLSAASIEKGWFADLNPNQNELSYLVSPCLDFSKITKDPILEFSLIYKLQNPALWIEVTKDEVIWTKLGAFGTGKNWYNSKDSTWSNGSTNWTFASHALDSLAGSPNARIRFVLRSDESMGGIGIDNVNIIAAPKRDVVAANLANLTQNECGLPADSLKLSITNNGTQTETGFTVSYRVNNLPRVTENVGTFSLLPGETKVYTFKTTANTAIPGTLSIRAWADLVPDESRFNDTTGIRYFNGGVTTPIAETFENGYPQGWASTANVFTISNSHGATSNVLYANLNNTNKSGIFSLPLFGLVKAGDSLRFDFRIVEGAATLGLLTSRDSIVVQASKNCDNQFKRLLRIDSTNHVASLLMKRMSVSLKDYVSSYVKIRVLVYRNGGNPIFIDFDNINTSNCTTPVFAVTVEPTLAAFNNGKITIDPTGGKLPYTYQWSNGGNDFKIFGLSKGNYSVTITDALGCKAFASYDIGINTKTFDQELVNSCTIVPNPSNGNFSINVEFAKSVEQLDMTLFTLTGTRLSSKQLNNVDKVVLPLDLSDQPAGIYFVRFITGERQWVQKIILSK